MVAFAEVDPDRLWHARLKGRGVPARHPATLKGGPTADRRRDCCGSGPGACAIVVRFRSLPAAAPEPDDSWAGANRARHRIREPATGRVCIRTGQVATDVAALRQRLIGAACRSAHSKAREGAQLRPARSLAATPQPWPAIVGPALKESPAGCCLDSAASPRFGPSQTPSGPRRAPPVRISISEGVVARANRALDPAKRPFCEPSGVTGACPAGARTPRGCSGFRESLLILVA